MKETIEIIECLCWVSAIKESVKLHILGVAVLSSCDRLLKLVYLRGDHVIICFQKSSQVADLVIEPDTISSDVSFAYSRKRVKPWR